MNTYIKNFHATDLRILFCLLILYLLSLLWTGFDAFDHIIFKEFLCERLLSDMLKIFATLV